MKAAECTLTAFMPEADAPNPGNPIHSNDSARARGFKAALVGGATVYGWAVRTIVESLGNAWLDYGWAELSFRRPVYPGDCVAVRVDGNGALEIGVGEAVCVNGTVGLGDAPWRHDLTTPGNVEAQPPPPDAPRLTPANVPIGRDLRARSVSVSRAESEAFCLDKLAEGDPPFSGPRARLHPAWLASQPIFLLHHSFRYGPAIHTASRIQQLAPAFADQTITVAGRCVDAIERNGNHYIVNDVLMLDSVRTPIAHIRHTAIYQMKERAIK